MSGEIGRQSFVDRVIGADGSGAHSLDSDFATQGVYGVVRVGDAGLSKYIQTDPPLLVGIPQLARVAAYGEGLPIKVDGTIVGATASAEERFRRISTVLRLGSLAQTTKHSALT
jgi:hypothetical protein